MPETRTIRIKDATDGKTYDVTLNESSRTLKSSASNSVALVRDRITGAANNKFTTAQATTIALQSIIRMQEEGLFI